MADTKKIVAKNVTFGVPCPKKSVLKKDENGKPIAGEYEIVELKHVEPGQVVTIDADEADHLIGLGFAEEVKPELVAKPAK